MTTHAHLQRQLALALFLQHAKRAHPFDEIQAYLFSQSSLRDVMSSYTKRTFQRDLLVIAEDFAVNVSYDQKQRGYVLTSTDPLPPGHQRLLEALELQVFLRLPAALAPHVQLEARQPLGLEHLRPLLAAVQARQQVAFSYCKFWEEQPTRRLVGPLLLKEFKGRWYVLAVKPETGELRCFGLDRITDLQPSARSFATPAGFEASTYYEQAFGIIRPDDEQPQEIVLSLTPTQGRYVQSYPLHATQQLLSQSDTETRLRLRIFDTHDLRMELLSMGEEVEVLAPASLRQWLNQTVKAVATNYKHRKG
ncbi:helix-turn-helix transcriptional regulator [Hymenobacter sp. IS2118]|uniref:helix-turn-helix transcriptional regulator n=1 Tax=Hymenobacter sp. IS2118 TaxID=1505605 RepID=UPI0005592BF3|nr:WYL domain-containing protein [Hymenobacter sp. IS2118]